MHVSSVHTIVGGMGPFMTGGRGPAKAMGSPIGGIGPRTGIMGKNRGRNMGIRNAASWRGGGTVGWGTFSKELSSRPDLTRRTCSSIAVCMSEFMYISHITHNERLWAQNWLVSINSIHVHFNHFFYSISLTGATLWGYPVRAKCMIQIISFTHLKAFQSSLEFVSVASPLPLSITPLGRTSTDMFHLPQPLLHRLHKDVTTHVQQLNLKI